MYGYHFLARTENISALKQAMLNHPYPQSLDNQKRQFKVLEDFNGLGLLSKIQADTLIVYGIEDIVSLPSESIFLAKNIQNATLLAFD